MINQFKEQIDRQGLARNSRWLCRIYPPKGLANSSNIFNFNVGGGELAVNLPGVDLIDNAVEQFNNLNLNVGLGNLGSVNIGNNLNLPTLGFTLTNTLGTIDALNLFCVSAAIPERDLKNIEWTEYGESRQLGFLHTHSKGLSVSYYCSEDLRERLFMEKWQDSIFNPDNKRRSYYEDYIGNIEIVKFDTGWNNQTAMYRFKEAYPSNIAAQNLTYDGTSVLRLDINFKFRNYERLK